MRVDGQLILLVAGAATIALGLLWRFISRRHQMSGLTRRLRSDENPAERARAGGVIVELGLNRAARPILRSVMEEPDNRVRLSIGLAVARRQWEPARAKKVAQLRAWAANELDQQGRPVREFGPAVTRLADMGGPRGVPWTRKPAAANGNGATDPGEADRAATAVPTPAISGNGNGHGVRGPLAAPAAVTYRPGKPPVAEPAAAPVPAPDDDTIRWVAPDIGDRADS